MSNVRKIIHRKRQDGSAGATSWKATWIGADGKRQSKNFPKKGEADAFLKSQGSGLVGGSAAMTVADLARAHYGYFDSLVRQGVRDPVTRDAYASHLDLHIASDPGFHKRRLCDLTTPIVQGFLDDLLQRHGSLDLVKRLRRSLVTWCKFGQRKGWLLTNPAQPCIVEKVSRAEDEDPVIIPGKNTLGALLSAAAEGEHPERDSAIVRLLMFGGPRISELLGLADDAALPSPAGVTLKIRERLDRRYRVLGPTKTASGRRAVPIGPVGSRAVKAWRIKRGPVRAFLHTSQTGQVKRVPGRLFPDPKGGDLWGYNDFMRQCWLPLMRRAGLVDMIPDSKGKNRPVQAFGPHTLRHVAVSLWIEQGLQPKKVQQLVGHATLAMTMDLYGHLWADDAQDAALALESERLIQTPGANRNI